MNEHAPDGRGGHPRLRALWFVAPLVLVWAVPVAVLAVAAPLAGRAESANVAAQVPEVVPVGARMAPASRPTTVQLGFAQPSSVTARRSGVVTAIDVAVGDPVHPGRPLISIDGVTVLAYPAAVPLFRDLGRGDRGADVAALGDYLVALGVIGPPAAGPSFGAGMEAGVRRVEKELLGVEPTGRFRLGYVAFVPSSATTVASVQVQLGQDVATGAPIATMAGAPTSLAFLDPSSGQPMTTTGTVSLQVGADRLDLPSLTVPAAQIPDVYWLLLAGVAQGAITRTSPDQGQGAAGGAAAAMGSGVTELYNGAVLVEAADQDTGTVPATAVYTTAYGTSCVFVAVPATTPGATSAPATTPGATASPGPTGPPVAATGGYQARVLGAVGLVRGQLGVVAVPSDLVGANVVRNPLALPGQVLGTCTSR